MGITKIRMAGADADNAYFEGVGSTTLQSNQAPSTGNLPEHQQLLAGAATGVIYLIRISALDSADAGSFLAVAEAVWVWQRWFKYVSLELCVAFIGGWFSLEGLLMLLSCWCLVPWVKAPGLPAASLQLAHGAAVVWWFA